MRISCNKKLGVVIWALQSQKQGQTCRKYLIYPIYLCGLAL
jgi:hypothetical protein